jgi:hypothetical protein
MRIPEHPTLIRRMRDSRLTKLAEAGPLVAATLVEAEVRCGKEGCRCRKGGGHLTRFLTFKRNGKTVSVYVPKHRLAEVKWWVREHKRIKVLVREISELTMELMRAEERALRRRR